MWITYAKVIPQWPKISNMHSDVKIKKILSPERPGKLLTRLIKKYINRGCRQTTSRKRILSQESQKKNVFHLSTTISLPPILLALGCTFPRRVINQRIILEGKAKSRPHRKSPKEYISLNGRGHQPVSGHIGQAHPRIGFWNVNQCAVTRIRTWTILWRRHFWPFFFYDLSLNIRLSLLLNTWPAETTGSGCIQGQSLYFHSGLVLFFFWLSSPRFISPGAAELLLSFPFPSHIFKKQFFSLHFF